MKNILFTLMLMSFSTGISQQTQIQNTINDSIPIPQLQINQLQINGYQRILSNLSGIPQGVTLGGYGEILYNQPDNLTGELDVQRLVLLFGYKFNVG